MLATFLVLAFAFSVDSSNLQYSSFDLQNQLQKNKRNKTTIETAVNNISIAHRVLEDTTAVTFDIISKIQCILGLSKFHCHYN